jgi:hypothetical protein
MLLKGLHHVVHSGRCGAEKILHIALGRGLAMDGGVGMDEGQVKDGTSPVALGIDSDDRQVRPGSPKPE